MNSRNLRMGIMAVLVAQGAHAATYRKQPYLLPMNQPGAMGLAFQTNATPTSLDIRWGLTSAVDGGVAAAPTLTHADFVYRAVLAGLPAGQRIFYRVIMDGVTSTGSFVAPRGKDLSDITFYGYGDTRTNPKSHDLVAKALLADMNADPATRATFALHVGDYVSTGTNETDWTNTFFTATAPNILQMLANVPLMGIIGNHEGAAGGLVLKYFPYPFWRPTGTGCYYSFDQGPVHVTVIDSETVTYTAGTPEYAWIEADLAASSAPLKMALFHSPAYSANGGHTNNTVAQASIVPLFEKYGVKIVLSGDNHYYARIPHNGVQYLTSGGGGAPLYTPDAATPGLAASASTYEFVRFQVMNNATLCRLTAMNTSGGVLDTLDIALTPATVSDIVFTQQPQSVTVAEGLTATFTVSATGSMPMSYAWSRNNVAIPGATSASYTTAPVTGADNGASFKVTVTDPTGSLSSNAAILTVLGANRAPVATPQTVTVPKDAPKAITLAATDADGDALGYTVVTQPAHGTLSGTAPTLTYTPAAGYLGADSFTFKANDGKVDSAPATVTLDVKAIDTSVPTLIISQYYEGISYNKWIEVTNVGGGAYDPATTTPMYLGLVANPFAATPSYTAVPVPAVAPGASVLLYNEQATLPLLANVTGTPVAAKTAINFNGDDIVYLSPANGGATGAGPAAYDARTDALGTNDVAWCGNTGTTSNAGSGDWTVILGKDRSYVRKASVATPNPAFSMATLAGEWTQVDAVQITAAAPSLVDTAAPTDTNRLGFHVFGGVVANHAPVATPQSVTVTQDVAQAITLAATDADAGDALTYAIVTQPAHGTLTGTAPALTYTPAAGFSGADSFTFKANDGKVDSAPAAVNLTVSGAANHAPVATPQSVAVTQDVAQAITLAATDADAGDVLTYVIVTQPAHGTLTGTAPALTYTPAAGFSGADSFTFKANDGKVDSAVATVTLAVNHVNHAPVANAQTVNVNQEVATTVTLTATDADASDTLAYAIVTQPAHGTLTGTGATRVYTPATGFSGTDSFTFKANDGTVDSAPATVTLTVAHVNHAPVATAQTVTLNQDASSTVTLAGMDADGDVLTYTILTQPAHGTLTGTGASRTYTPATGFSGADSFTFKANDGTVDSAPATITLAVTHVNHAPVATAQTVGLDQDVATSVLLAATDPDGDVLTFAIVTQPAHGTLSGSGASRTYTPATGFSGADSFTFKANDGTVDSAPATVTLNVVRTNHAPVVTSAAVGVSQDGSAAIVLSASDADGDALTYTLVTQPVHGTLTGSGAIRTYTPAAGFSGLDSFTYKAGDGVLESTAATISVHVNSLSQDSDPGVDGADVLSFVRALGTASPTFDFNGDGKVDDADLAVLLAEMRK